MELLVITEFEELDGKTKIYLQHTGLPDEMSEECIKGWQSSFVKLDENFKY